MQRLGLFTFFSICFMFAAAAPAAAADLLIEPASGTYEVGEELKVQVRVNPGGDTINAAEGAISFNNNLMTVKSVSKDGSAFSLWTPFQGEQDTPFFSNGDGLVGWSGGAISAISNPSTLFTITFSLEAAGAAELAISDGIITSADGSGTDVFGEGKSASFTITEGSEPEPEPEPEPVSDVDPPGAPDITSSTHADSEKWYNKTTAIFSWKAPSDVTAVRLLISEDENAVPTVVHEPPLSTRTIEDLDDGVWWFFAELRNDGGWGPVGKKKIQIDTVPPEPFEIAFADGTPPTFTFEATDTLSGIEKYDIKVGEWPVVSVVAADVKDGSYPVPPQDGGEQLVTITAYDKASNTREASGTFDLPLVKKPEKPKAIDEEEESPPLLTGDRMLAMFFVFLAGIAFTMYYLEHNQAKKEHNLVLKELISVREKSDKIFAALQDEIEEQIGQLNEKPQPTPAEREVLESLHEALDMSEELIAMEVEELRRKVRERE